MPALLIGIISPGVVAADEGPAGVVGIVGVAAVEEVAVEEDGITRLAIKFELVTMLRSAELVAAHRNELFDLDGAMPRLNAIPSGCAFNPRCAQVMPRCLSERPELIEAGTTRAACWLHEGQS